MTTIRTKKRENPFVQIDKSIFTNSDISWKAKGILGYLLSKPDDWVTYITDLEKRSTDGRDSVRKGLKELEDHGYLRRKRVRDGGKFKGWEYTVYEIPEIGFTEVGKSEIGLSEIGKSNTTNKEITNNDLSNKEKTNKEYIPFVEIINYLNGAANTNYRSSTKATQRVIKARWNEGFKIQDFKKVIDKKSAEWLNDPKMNKFLRPETLFGTKFESYLNQKGGGQAASNRQRIGTDDETKSKIRETNERRKRIARVKSDTDSDLPF
ncbi:conserved phage C-terminal domain-containing protein [Heyndrickxia sp. FSL W8-0496]|uniref:conserved phage C-terminal domain-containing protein n=1 Tax=Heyndrickxia sp. FSL W8-0496 TaxID=2954702 RepID=UPI0030F73C2E